MKIWPHFFIPKSGRKYSYTNTYNFAMTLISQDDHLAAGAWAYFALSIQMSVEIGGYVVRDFLCCFEE